MVKNQHFFGNRYGFCQNFNASSNKCNTFATGLKAEEHSGYILARDTRCLRKKEKTIWIIFIVYLIYEENNNMDVWSRGNSGIGLRFMQSGPR